MKSSNIENKLAEINNLHPNLTFAMEKQTDGMIPFLDMKISNRECNLSSTWYNKPTNTGLILNVPCYHALVPKTNTHQSFKPNYRADIDNHISKRPCYQGGRYRCYQLPETPHQQR